MFWRPRGTTPGMEAADQPRGPTPDPPPAPAPSPVVTQALFLMPVPLFVLAPVREAGRVVDFVVEYVNHAGGAAAGLVAEEIMGKRLLEGLPAYPRDVFDVYVEVLDSGTQYRTRFEYQDTFDEARPVAGVFELTATKVGDAVLVTYDEVSEQLRARQAEQRSGALLEATSDWVSIADGDGNLLYINPSGRRMVGLGLDEDLAGARIGDFSPKWARERLRGEALEAARREGVWRGDLARLHRDGHEIPVSQVVVARANAAGVVDFYASIARDMSGERAVEAALRSSEERFRVAFEQAPMGMSFLDLEGRFVQVNDAYCRIVRRTRDDLLGRSPVEITHPDDIDFTNYAIRTVMNDEVPVFRFEKRYVDGDGETIWVEISGSVFRGADGEPQFVIGMVQDLSERHVAHTLQRSMLTTRLPDVDGVDLAVRYLPGSPDTEVSGDWYDVIPLPGGRVGVVTGDVVGRGIEAAATMSQLRTALRAYAIEGLQPGEVIGKLHKMVDRLGIGLSTTLVYLDLQPLTRELRYASAGHLPPLLVTAGGGSHFLDGARSTPLGASPAGVAVAEERLVLEAGDTVLLYTDGLVERRHEPIDRRLAELQRAMAAAPGDLDACLEHLTSTLAHDAPRPDDVALLALRPQPVSTEPFAATIRDGVRDLAAMRASLRAWLVAAGAGEEEVIDALIAVGEACANAIEHAGAAAGAQVDVGGRRHVRDVVLTVSDRGVWRPVTARADRGHGLRLMRVLMDGVDIATGDDGTRIELRLALTGEPRPQAPLIPAPQREATLAFRREHGMPVARLEGEVDLARVPELRAELVAAVEPSDRGLVLDLTGVDYVDSAGLHLLHDLARTLAARGQGLRAVAGADDVVRRVLELVGLARTVPLEATVAAAAAALEPPGAAP